MTVASPLDVLTSVLELAPGDTPMPDWPPKATLIVSGAFVVLVNVSSQRPQFAPVLTYTEREMVTPPMSTDCVVLKRSTPSKSRPKPRITSPLRHGAGVVCTRTLMPPKPLIAVLNPPACPAGAICVARMLPVSTRGDAASWMPQ